MRARTVDETIKFERGMDPFKSLDIGNIRKHGIFLDGIYVNYGDDKKVHISHLLDPLNEYLEDVLEEPPIISKIPGAINPKYKWKGNDISYGEIVSMFFHFYDTDRENFDDYIPSGGLAGVFWQEFLNESFNESKEEYSIKYEPWKWGGYSEGHNAWYLYKNGKPIVGISNDNKDQNKVLIRHIESKEKGMASKFILSLLRKGISFETGKSNYNSISTSAYYMNKKITNLVKKNPDLGFKILGKANNKGKDDEERYKDVMDKKDNYHYKWFKKVSQ